MNALCQKCNQAGTPGVEPHIVSEEERDHKSNDLRVSDVGLGHSFGNSDLVIASPFGFRHLISSITCHIQMPNDECRNNSKARIPEGMTKPDIRMTKKEQSRDAGSDVHRRAGLSRRFTRLFGVPQNRRHQIEIASIADAIRNRHDLRAAEFVLKHLAAITKRK
jgi:hypothetical protein